MKTWQSRTTAASVMFLLFVFSVAAVAEVRPGDLRNRPLLGVEVLRDYEFDGKSTWCDGKFYAHRKGKTASPKLTLSDENQLKNQVKILFVKKSFVWKRI